MRQTNRLLSLISVVLIAACTDNSITNPYGDVSGQYHLTVFDGQSLPAILVYQPAEEPSLPNGGTVEWTDGTMNLSTDGTFVEADNYVVTPSGGSSTQGSFISRGTYTLSGTAFTLSAPAQNGYPQRFATGTIQFDKINYKESNSDGSTSSFEYRR